MSVKVLDLRVYAVSDSTNYVHVCIKTRAMKGRRSEKICAIAGCVADVVERIR